MRANLVTVYHAKQTESTQMVLLIILTGSEPQVSDQHQAFDWKHLAFTTLEDKLLAYARPIIEAQIDIHGCAFLQFN